MIDQRKGEVAYVLIRYKMVKEGLSMEGGVWHSVERLAGETGLPVDELREFFSVILDDVVSVLRQGG